MAKDYIKDECGAKFPLNYTFDGVNNFVFSTDVMFEDLQMLCLELSGKLEAAEHRVQRIGFKPCQNCGAESEETHHRECSNNPANR